jgi:metal-responsive CopG/Arc/MetJ family transcriptional regulator
MPKITRRLCGAPAARIITTVPVELLSRIDRQAMPCAGGRSEFIRQALAERVKRMETRNKRTPGHLCHGEPA